MSNVSPKVSIGKFTTKATTWNPSKQAHGTKINYIDLGSVDNVWKRIAQFQQIDAELAPSRARQRVRAGDILVSTVRPNLNGVAQVPAELDGATASTGFCVLRADEKNLSSRYLFHWVRTSAFVEDMVRQSTGASYPAITDRIIFASEMPLPKFSEQIEMADLLDCIDKMRHRRNESGLVIARLEFSIFNDMFGDPTSSFGEYPLKTLSDIVLKLEGGKNLVGADDISGQSEFRVLKISAVSEYGFDPAETKPLPLDYVPPKSHFVQAGDLLISRANTSERVGLAALVGTDVDIKKLVLPDKLLRFVWRDPGAIDPQWMLGLLRHPSIRRRIESIATGTSGSMKNISQEKLLGLQVSVPPIELQRAFSKRLSAIRMLKISHAKQMNQLNKLLCASQGRIFSSTAADIFSDNRAKVGVAL